MITNTPNRLIRAIESRWKTKKEAAAALGFNPRQLNRWENGELPKIITSLEEHGIICIIAPTDQPEQVAA